MYECMHICVCVFVCLHACMLRCMCVMYAVCVVYVHVCMCVYVYVWHVLTCTYKTDCYRQALRKDNNINNKIKIQDAKYVEIEIIDYSKLQESTTHTRITML